MFTQLVIFDGSNDSNQRIRFTTVLHVDAGGACHHDPRRPGAVRGPLDELELLPPPHERPAVGHPLIVGHLGGQVKVIRITARVWACRSHDVRIE